MLTAGANPTIRTTGGDNAVIAALADKYWAEDNVIELCRHCDGQFLDSTKEIDMTTRNGHSALHLCVRRDWTHLLSILMTHGASLDVANVNGVTPLMTACFRNNSHIVQVLVENGANVLKEDNHGRMALCYAIAAAMRNSSTASGDGDMSGDDIANWRLNKERTNVIDLVLEKVLKYSSFNLYLKRILAIIVGNYELSEMFVNVIRYAVRYTNDGVRALLALNIFQQLNKVLKESVNDRERTKFILEVCLQILLYNEECHSGCVQSVKNLMLDSFFASGVPNLLLGLLQKSTSQTNYCQISSIAFNLILLAVAGNTNTYSGGNTSNNGGTNRAQSWVRKNHRKLTWFVKGSTPPFRQHHLESKCYQKLRDKLKTAVIQSEVTSKLKERYQGNSNTSSGFYKTTAVKGASISGQNTKGNCSVISCSSNREKNQKGTAIPPLSLPLPPPPKSFESTSESVGDDSYYDGNNPNLEWSLPCHYVTESPANDCIVNAIKSTVLSETFGTMNYQMNVERDGDERIALLRYPNYQPLPDWHRQLLSMPFANNSNGFNMDVYQASQQLQLLDSRPDLFDKNINLAATNSSCNVETILMYLHKLLHLLIEEYQKTWFCALDEDPIAVKEMSKLIFELQLGYDVMLNRLRELGNVNRAEFLRISRQIESHILNHRLDGGVGTLMDNVCCSEEISVTFNALNRFGSYANYLENVLNRRDGNARNPEILKIVRLNRDLTIAGVEYNPPTDD